jgi:hypothetical protein
MLGALPLGLMRRLAPDASIQVEIAALGAEHLAQARAGQHLQLHRAGRTAVWVALQRVPKTAQFIIVQMAGFQRRDKTQGEGGRHSHNHSRPRQRLSHKVHIEIDEAGIHARTIEAADK